ncbi:MAG: hypothetical protein ACREQJ_18805, partial [Candidatus Binatia bacterium]
MDEPFTILSPSLREDPYPHYRRLRETTPVHRDPIGVWLLTRYDDLARFFGDGRSFQLRYRDGQTLRFGEAVVDEPWFRTFRHMIAFLDEPDHGRIRRFFSGTFTPSRVRALAPRVEAIAHDLLESLGEAFDAISAFALPLPIRVIGELLGVPEPDRDRVGALARRATDIISFLPKTTEEIADINAATVELSDYFHGLAAHCRKRGGDGLF